MNEQLYTEAELRVLNVLWDKGPGNIFHVSRHMYGNTEPSKVQSVKVLMERLEAKGLTARRLRKLRKKTSYGWIQDMWIWSCVLTKNDVITQQLDTIIEKLCGGSRLRLIMQLIDGGNWPGGAETVLEKLLDMQIDASIEKS